MVAPSGCPTWTILQRMTAPGTVRVTFLGHATHAPALGRMRAHLAPQGRVAVGFGTARGYLPEAFFADVETAGLQVDATFSTWDLRPYAPDSDFLVAILSAA